MASGGTLTKVFVALALALAVGGCEQMPVTAMKPCPTGGIELRLRDLGPPDQRIDQGTPPSPGGECSGGACGKPQWSCTGFQCKPQPPEPDTSQVAEYKRYACTAPQICPDMDEQRVLHDVASGPLEVGFLLTNCSTGAQPLMIDEVLVLGDDRCAFSNVGAADISTKVINPGETAAIRLRYDPAAAGEDHAVLAVRSNAHNDAVMHLRICGLAVTAPPVRGDRSLLDLRCRGSATRASCHK